MSLTSTPAQASTSDKASTWSIGQLGPALHSPLGATIPPNSFHAVSVSLPAWADNVGYVVGEKRVADALVSGYPRFFIHQSIQKLATRCERAFAENDERVLLFPTRTTAEHCRAFILDHLARNGEPLLNIRLLKVPIDPTSDKDDAYPHLHIVLIPGDGLELAHQFWQNAGMGITSRFSEHCLSTVLTEYASDTPSALPNLHGFPIKSEATSSLLPPVHFTKSVVVNGASSSAVEKNTSPSVKPIIRRRIAGLLTHEDNDSPIAGVNVEVDEDDVYLFTTGMSAIWTAYYIIRTVRPPGKAACFGLPYIDTLRVLQRNGLGLHFFGLGSTENLDALEALLEPESILNPDKPPIQVLHAEFPSNPRLHSPDLARLRALADRYDFLIVVDDTVGNLVNVDVLPYADIVCTSLSKIFSGNSDVAGGSLVLNSSRKHYTTLKQYLNVHFDDGLFEEDAIALELNSRDIVHRVGVIDRNAETLADFLHSRSIAGNPATNNKNSPFAITQVLYPKYRETEVYDRCRRTRLVLDSPEGGYRKDGYGGLISLNFVSVRAAQVFHDSTLTLRGTSLGTNFSLTSPYTILAHYDELDWSTPLGVGEDLVRISVGMERIEDLLEVFRIGCEAAERYVATSGAK